MAEFDSQAYPIVLPPQGVRDKLPQRDQSLTQADSGHLEGQSPPALTLADDAYDQTIPLEPEEAFDLINSDSPAPADPVAPSLVEQLIARAACPHPWHHPIRFVGWAISMTFGIATLILALAVVAAIPIVNFIALGYLLEVEGRIGRSGRVRDGFPLLSIAPRVGSIAIGLWLFLLPLRFIAWSAADARLISPGSAADIGWHVVLYVSATVVTVHLCLALARGGRLSTFFRPIKNVLWFVWQWRTGTYWERAEVTAKEFLAQLHPIAYFWKGLRGWLGGFLWLVIPTAIFAAADKPNGGAALVSISGGILLMIVLSWVPFLQARFAAEDRLSVFRQLGAVRELYRKAPICFTLATIVTYALSLPLFFATIALPPQDALWLVTPIFIMSIYPARVFTGWAYYQAQRRERRAWFSLRLLMGLLLMPALAFYTFLLFFTPFIGSSGKLVLFQHHALLLPRPF